VSASNIFQPARKCHHGKIQNSPSFKRADALGQPSDAQQCRRIERRRAGRSGCAKALTAKARVEESEILRKTLTVIEEDLSGSQYDLARLFELVKQEATLRKLASESREGVVEFAESLADNGTATFETDVSDTLPPPPKPKKEK